MIVRSLASVAFLAFVALLTACGGGKSRIDTPPPADGISGIVNEITPQDALPRVQAAYAQFVDVRTPQEYVAGHAVRAINIPLEELPSKLDRLEKNEPVYIICQTGRRSREAGEILLKNGYPWVFSVTGGTSAWQTAELPMEGVRP
jgi:rhodanese-related sulfurtransferase